MKLIGITAIVVFNPETFRDVFRRAGLKVEVFGGYWLKPVSNQQTEETWSDEMLQAFMELGERYPDIAGEIYFVACHPDLEKVRETK